MYFSYFVLFARFFYKAYLAPGGHKGRRMAASLAAQNAVKQSSSPPQDNTVTSKFGIGSAGEDQAAYLRKTKAQ